jgi:hypothetical protein
LRQSQSRFSWGYSTTAHTRVHLDNDTQLHLRAGGGGGKRRDGPLVVDRNYQVGLPRKLGEALDLDRSCELICHQDTLNPSLDQCFRLAKRSASDSDRTAVQLPAGKSHALVVLVVGAQSCGSLCEKGGHFFEIAFHDMHIEQKSGGSYL